MTLEKCPHLWVQYTTRADCWRLKADGWLQTAAPHLHSTPTEPLSKKGGVKKWGVNNYGYSRDSQIAGRKSLNAADGCLLKADSRSQPQSLSFATCRPRPATRADCWLLMADCRLQHQSSKAPQHHGTPAARSDPCQKRRVFKREMSKTMGTVAIRRSQAAGRG